MRAMLQVRKLVSSSKLISFARIAAVCALVSTGVIEAIGFGSASAELGTGLVLGTAVAAFAKAFHIV